MSLDQDLVTNGVGVLNIRSVYDFDGIDTAVPDKVLKMPSCDLRDPSAIPYGAQLYQKLTPSTQFISIELTYRDGSVSEVKSFRTANRSNN